jgi:topoisomerase-4 subunit A
MPISQKGVRVIGTAARSGKATDTTLNASDLAHHIGKRARKGKVLASRIKAMQLQALE